METPDQGFLKGAKSLGNIIDQLREDLLSTHLDALLFADDGTPNENNERLLQIAAIYKIIYGDDLNLEKVIVD